jgi:glycosyltransferase involved in cell wall biosynthesis
VKGSRLGIVIAALDYHGDRKGGAGKLAYDQARYLASEGHDVWLVAQGPSGRFPEHQIDGGVNVVRYPVMPFAALDPRRFSYHRSSTRAALLRHMKGTVDALHGHAPQQFAALAPIFPRARKCYSVHSPVRLELIASSRGAAISERLRLRLSAGLNHRIERQCIRVADTVTAESSFTRSLVSEGHGRDLGRKVQVVPGWADVNRFAPQGDIGAARRELGWPEDRPVFFCLRRLVPRMGIELLLNAAAALHRRHPGFCLVIGGTGPLAARLERLCRDLGLQEAVRFVGFVPDEALPAMYGAADAFVLPTAELECFGLIAIESLSCGRPVLATPVGAIPEILAGLEPRWLSRDATASSLEELITEFVQGRLPVHPPERLREFVVERYSLARRVPELVAALLGGTAARPAGEPMPGSSADV